MKAGDVATKDEHAFVKLAGNGSQSRAYTFSLLVIPQFVGILGGTLVNFAASRAITFR